MEVPVDIAPAEVFAAYRTAWRTSNDIVRELADLSTRTAVTTENTCRPAGW
jgi:hypothetical protein